MTSRKYSARRRLTDKEEAEIQRMIASDPDNPEITDAQIAKLKPFAEAFPALAESIKRSRGRPRAEEPKAAVTLRLAPSTLARFQAASPDWRKRMAAILDKAKV